MCIEKCFSALDWERIGTELDQRGWAVTGPLLCEAQRYELIRAYEKSGLFRSTVIMARHGFGRGEYRYFAYPLPELVRSLRELLYERLVPIANRWRSALRDEPFPLSYADFLAGCH